ncbi:MAG: twitching motility protein [Parcubacteria group bacterium Gr01-1014_18]|nr:MAG: twitching motility protein [Parcubacteria group bacterium Greene0416_36]TSC81010.1 MAG: twitching motility protein [Parcubacteria group bacterium Gr01-1014_18]TSC98932.1 MAG: twitching motility protein [Parcubacteria group bacterium Greene1014_20]TSD06776.1 MAG: twitching motility protein [Parcubacteria group bacterium Greene0714_2]
MPISPATLLNQIFQEANDQEASDIHLLAFMPPYIRVDGALRPLVGYEALSDKQLQDMGFAILRADQRDRFTESREMDIAYQTPDATRYRVNLHWEKNTVALAARIISSKIPTMSELNLPQIVYDLIKKPAGLVLVTGPTGCGKSTTLASLIESINIERAEHIVTLEDPIEFVYQSKKSLIAQRQLGVDMANFQDGLKHVLRQDPNVILVGEMRDPETIAMTITLAETGHLVFATLHTYNAPQTIDRIIDTFPPYQQTQVRLQLSITLQGVISQRLLPKVGGGRVAAREVLINNPAIGNLIRENKMAQMKTVMQTSADEGMVTMDQNLARLYREGKIVREDAITFMDNPMILEKK